MIEHHDALSSKELDALADELVAAAHRTLNGTYKDSLILRAAELRLKAKLMRLSEFKNGTFH